MPGSKLKHYWETQVRNLRNMTDTLRRISQEEESAHPTRGYSPGRITDNLKIVTIDRTAFELL